MIPHTLILVEYVLKSLVRSRRQNFVSSPLSQIRGKTCLEIFVEWITILFLEH